MNQMTCYSFLGKHAVHLSGTSSGYPSYEWFNNTEPIFQWSSMIFNEFIIQVQAKDEDLLRSAALQALFIDWNIETALIQPIWTFSISLKINEK